MYVLLSYWNGKNSSKSKTIFNVIATSDDEEEITDLADEALEDKIFLLDEGDRETTEVSLIDPSDLFVAPGEDLQVIYHKSAGPTGVNEWHIVIVEVDHNEAIPPLVLESLKGSLKDDSGVTDELRAITISDILEQLGSLDDESLVVYLEDLRDKIDKARQ